MRLFCPRCGDELHSTPDGMLKCQRGDMILAAELAKRLRDCYVDSVRRPKDGAFTYAGLPRRTGGIWFCPGCGVSIPEESPGNLTCPKCSRSVVEFVYALIERHPHL